jgi:hypothetical protein
LLLIIYDPDFGCPIYHVVTEADINDVVAAKQMPIDPGATYVFDLGYYDYGWWIVLAVVAPAVRSRPGTGISIPVAPPGPWTIKAVAQAPPIATPAVNPLAAAIGVTDPANRFNAFERQIKAANRHGRSGPGGKTKTAQSNPRGHHRFETYLHAILHHLAELRPDCILPWRNRGKGAEAYLGEIIW